MTVQLRASTPELPKQFSFFEEKQAGESAHSNCKLSKLGLVNLLGLIDFAHILVQLRLSQSASVGLQMCTKSIERLQKIRSELKQVGYASGNLIEELQDALRKLPTSSLLEQKKALLLLISGN